MKPKVWRLFMLVLIPGALGLACQLPGGPNDSAVDLARSSVKTRSSDGIFGVLYVDNFEKYQGNPILAATQEWESNGTREVGLLVDSSGCLVKENGNYIMYHNGQDSDGDIQIGRATSPDGIRWTEYSGNPVFSQVWGAIQNANYAFVGSVIRRGEGDYILYYAHRQVGFNYATSCDGIHWTPNTVNDPILARGDFESLSEIDIPYVTRIDGTWYMVLEAVSSVDNRFRIYMASSADGYTWSASNQGRPIYSGGAGWDDYAVANPSLYRIAHGEYVIFYNGEASEGVWDIGVISSTCLTRGWKSWKNRPILARGASGTWDSTRIEGAKIAMDDLHSSSLRMWYFGLPTTDSFSRGAIGYATSESTRMTQAGCTQGADVEGDAAGGRPDRWPARARPGGRTCDN